MIRLDDGTVLYDYEVSVRMSCVYKFIESTLRDQGIDFFVGGSQRFGWSREKILFERESDLNIFLYLPEEELLTNTLFPRDLIHDSQYRKEGSTTPKWQVETEFLGKKVHFNFMESEEDFLKLKEEHEKVENYLLQNSEVLHLIKAGGLSGSSIYKILADLSKRETIPGMLCTMTCLKLLKVQQEK